MVIRHPKASAAVVDEGVAPLGPHLALRGLGHLAHQRRHVDHGVRIRVNEVQDFFLHEKILLGRSSRITHTLPDRVTFLASSPLWTRLVRRHLTRRAEYSALAFLFELENGFDLFLDGLDCLAINKCTPLERSVQAVSNNVDCVCAVAKFLGQPHKEAHVELLLDAGRS